MIALNFEGQLLIDDSKIQRIEIKKITMNALRDALVAIEHLDMEEAKEKIIFSYELINDACHLSFLAIPGLKPLVLNELSDSNIHNFLSQVSEKLMALYYKMFELAPELLFGTNLINLQLYKIKKELRNKIKKELHNTLVMLIDCKII